MGNRSRKSVKVRRELLGFSLVFFTISLFLIVYTFLEFRFGVSRHLIVKTHIELGVLSDFVFLLAVPLFLAALILQSFVLHRIVRKLTAAKQPDGGAILTPFGKTALCDAMPIRVECEDPEERGMMVTVC